MMWLPDRPAASAHVYRPRFVVPEPVSPPDPDELRCTTVPIYRGGPIVTIPGCWSAILYGDDACDCPGTPNAIAMERRGRALQRLQRLRERMRQRDLAAEGLAAFPNARPPYESAGPPDRIRALRVVR